MAGKKDKEPKTKAPKVKEPKTKAPKKKKLKHIRPTGQKSVALKEKWLSGMKVLDAEIRKTVNSLYKL